MIEKVTVEELNQDDLSALSSNNPTEKDVLKAYCNSHCRRQFVDLEL